MYFLTKKMYSTKGKTRIQIVQDVIKNSDDDGEFFK